MTSATNNTLAADQSAAPGQTGSIVLLASVIALVRAALVVIAALSLGSAARYFFPEMFVLPSNPFVLLAAVAIDTFAVATFVLVARARNAAARVKNH